MSDFTNKKGTEEHGPSNGLDCVFDWTSGEALTENSCLGTDSDAGSSSVVLESDIISDANR